MKSLTVWRGHSTPPSLPAGTARKASGHLSGRRPLHLANARPFGRLKAPLGLSLLRCAAQTRACLWQAEQAHHANNEKQKVPTGAFLPRGRQSAGHGLFESSLLLPHKIRAKQKEQHPIRCCSWCDREDSNLWPSGSENYDKPVQTNVEA